MRNATHQKILLENYKPTDFQIDKLELRFSLESQHVDVHSLMQVQARGSGSTNLVLTGVNLELLGVSLDGRELSSEDYQCEGDSLTIAAMPKSAQVEIRNRIYPAKNTSLEGLYASGSNLYTQCEAEGFRRSRTFMIARM